MKQPQSNKPCLQDLNLQQLSFLSQWGYPKYRQKQLYDAIVQYKDYNEITNLPEDLISRLSAEYHAQGLQVLQTFKSRDGSRKYLYKLHDNNIIEGVFMPHNYGNTLCVSTQVGCSMGCSFCASGIGGIIRNLSTGEIVSQVLCINRLQGGTKQKRQITNIVLMGSGEPLDNFDNVVQFLKNISDKDGLNVSLRNISLSTCGIVPKIYKLADLNMPIILSISLHATTDETRNKIMPINKVYNIASLIKAAMYYFKKTGRRIIFEYALIQGVNNNKQHAIELSTLVQGLPCHINLINLNYVKEKGKMGVPSDDIKKFMQILSDYKISNTLRRSMGEDIEGACGQLRNKYIKGGDVL